MDSQKCIYKTLRLHLFAKIYMEFPASVVLEAGKYSLFFSKQRKPFYFELSFKTYF